jgi:Ca-activated chloride channel homolog
LKNRILIAFIIICSIAFGQERKTRILFILDASNSMNSKWTNNQTRIQAAKELLAQTVDGLAGTPNLEIALRVYGHQSPITNSYQDCNDTKLEVPFGGDNFTRIKNRIRSIEAKGTTPIARSLEAAASDFPDTNTTNVIILITDGLEACDNDPCLIAKKLKEKGVKVTPFVIGLGMDLSYLDKFKCIGDYSEAETKDALKNVLTKVISKVLINTTVQININDINKNPKETDVTLFLYEAGTKNLKYTFTHTLNTVGNPDTLIIDPNISYDLVVNTTPRVEKKGIQIKKYVHNTIAVDAPQGFINVRFINAAKPYQIDSRVSEANSNKTINVQRMNVQDKYIVGPYQLEILTLPRTYVTVDVKQSSVSYVDISAPGYFTYKFSNLFVGQIFLKKEDDTFEWVCNLDQNSKSGQWLLQPGNYVLVCRQKNIKSTMNTIEREFRITSNKTSVINL